MEFGKWQNFKIVSSHPWQALQGGSYSEEWKLSVGLVDRKPLLTLVKVASRVFWGQIAIVWKVNDGWTIPKNKAYLLFQDFLFSVREGGIAWGRQSVRKVFSFTVVKKLFSMWIGENQWRGKWRRNRKEGILDGLRSRRLLGTWGPEYSGWMSFEENLSQQGWKNYLD